MVNKVSCTQINTTTAGNVTQSIQGGPYGNVSFQLVFASITGTQPSVKVQCSNDGTNWDDYPGATYATSATSETATLAITGAAFEAYRVYVTTASTTGTLNVYAVEN